MGRIQGGGEVEWRSEGPYRSIRVRIALENLLIEY